MYEDSVFEILTRDSKASKCFYGVYARDEIPNRLDTYPACLVINTHERSKPGEHWLAIYVNENKKATFFDSYGLSPRFYQLESALRRFSNKWTWNEKRLQGSSHFCGFYCVLFLLFAVRDNLTKFFKQFSTNLTLNDEMIEKFIIEFS
jgi:hypothetical protein